jgi:hypothetical protein
MPDVVDAQAAQAQLHMSFSVGHGGPSYRGHSFKSRLYDGSREQVELATCLPHHRWTVYTTAPRSPLPSLWKRCLYHIFTMLYMFTNFMGGSQLLQGPEEAGGIT